MALKADLVEHRPRGQGHVVNNMSGSNRSPSQYPGKQRQKNDKDNRGREKTKQGKERESSQSWRGNRNNSNARLCFNCDEMSDHWASNSPQPKKEEKKDEQRLITPYPRSRNSSEERGGANQGGDTSRKIIGFWGKGPMMERKSDTNTEEEEEGENKNNKFNKRKEEANICRRS